jgi:hypothetical protein
MPPKKKKASVSSATDDSTTPAKPKSVKKKKKLALPELVDGTAAPVVKKKKPASTKNLGTKKKKPVSTKNLGITPNENGNAGLPPKVPASPAKKSTSVNIPASPVPLSLASERRVSLPSPGASPAGRSPGARSPSPTMNGNGNGAINKSFRGTPAGGRGRGQGRGAPSSRNIGRNASYDAAPRRPQSMANLPGVPAKPQSMRAMNNKPQSRRGMSNKPQSFAARGGRGPAGRGMAKPLGRIAQSNRKLPPPPGTRGKSSRSLFGNSSHRPSSTLKMAHKPKSPDSSSESDDEFAGDSVEEENLRPASILRRGVPRGASVSKRTNADGTISMSLSGHSTGVSIDEDEEFEFSLAEPIVSGTHNSRKGVHRMQRPGLGINDAEHSMRGWTQSFRWGSKPKASGGADRRANMHDMSASKSVRSLLSVDMEFEGEPLWKQFLRYIRIMAPHPDEKPIKRNIRIFTWLALVFDFLTGLVSITTFSDVAYCCGEPVLSIAGDIDWHLAIQVTVYLYIVLIFAEILPVMREGFPFNLVNPFVGFLITFGMFFDDRILEAVIMWIIEATAVLCEFWVYRLKLRWHRQRQDRLDKSEADIKALKKEKRRRRTSNSTHHDHSDSAGSDLSFDEEGSFHDESFNSKEKEPLRPNDVSQIRETRLLRERRLLRQAQSEDTRQLRYHFTGVVFNVGLVFFSLMMISMVGRSGGLCIVDMIPPNIFKTGQLEKCFDCKGEVGPCEVCRDDGTSHCYYPYY